MSTNRLINKSILGKLSLFQVVVIALMLFPILKNAVTSILLGVAYFLSFFQPGFNLKSIINKNYRPYVYMFLFIFLMLLSLVYTDDLEFGAKKIRVAIHLFLIPFLLFIVNDSITVKVIDIAKKMYVFAVMFLCFYVLLFAYSELSFLYGYLTNSEVLYLILEKDYTYITSMIKVKEVTPYIELHEVYISIQVLCALVIVLSFLRKEISRQKQLVLYFIISFFLLFIIILGSKVNILVAIVFLLFFILNTLTKKTKKLIQFSFVSLFITSVLIMLLSCFSESNTDFVQSKKLNLIINKLGVGFKERAISNSCGISIIKDAFLIGVGVGDVQDGLNLCYKSKLEKAIGTKKQKYFNVNQYNFNSHNYYFFTLLFGGIPAFLALIFFFKGIYHESIHRESFYVCGIVIIVIVNLFFENYLSRIHGVLTFSLISALLYKESILKE